MNPWAILCKLTGHIPDESSFAYTPECVVCGKDVSPECAVCGDRATHRDKIRPYGFLCDDHAVSYKAAELEP